jgi:hypothetical protein
MCCSADVQHKQSGPGLQAAICALVVACFLVAWTQSHTVYTETLRILPNVGVVLTATAPSGFTTARFLDWQHVGPVIINEVSPLLVRFGNRDNVNPVFSK